MNFRNFGPLRARVTRKPMKKARPAERKESWRTGTVRETAEGIHKLRTEAFKRSQGVCECWRELGREGCFQRVGWFEGHLHHLGSRIERSDEIGKLAFIRPECHAEITGKLQFGKRA